MTGAAFDASGHCPLATPRRRRALDLSIDPQYSALRECGNSLVGLKKKMDIEENKRVVLRFLKDLGEKGYSVFGDATQVTEDFEWWVQGRGTFTGPQMLDIT